MTSAQFCNNCSTPKFEWSSKDLSSLYHEYRSDSYNRDRISVEPSYAAVKDRVGNDPSEVDTLYKSVDERFGRHLTRLPKGFSAGTPESRPLEDMHPIRLHEGIDENIHLFDGDAA